VRPGTPFTTTTTVPATAMVAPMASRRESRSPRSSGESNRSDVGSTVISSAALLAVEWAIPQLPNAKASAKPTMPIRAIRQRSGREIRWATSLRPVHATRIAAPISDRASPSVAGGTSASTMRITL
jgi:hypothetical protein